MRRCFLHIGTHKTGTTAIQVTLNTHRRQLAQRGFLYPRTGIPAGLSGHHNIAWQLRGDHRFAPELGTVEDLFSEIGKCDHDVILSSEDFQSTLDNLDGFISKLAQHGFQVEVIIYFRDQASYARTLYLGLTAHQGYPRTFEEFLAELIEHRAVRWREWMFTFDYRALLAQLPSAIPIVVRPFDPRTSVIGSFLSILGLSPADVKVNDPDFRTNTQEPISYAVAGLYRNRTGRDVKRKCKATMKTISRAFDGAPVGFGVAAKQRLIAALDASNRSMDAHYGLPVLTDTASAVVSPGAAPSSGLEMETVFSLATLSQIDRLYQSETQRKWSVFGRRLWG